MTIHDFLKIATVRGASDLHLKVGSYPMMRVHGPSRPCLAAGRQQGFISYEEALRWASNVDEFNLKVQGISTAAADGRADLTGWAR